MITYFQDFIRDNGLPVTVEYSATGGEPDFNFPGHICDGGGSGPEIVILQAWPNTPWHHWLAGAELDLWRSRRVWTPALSWLLKRLSRLDEWWRASLTQAELDRFTDWLAEHYVDEPDEDAYL